MIDSSVILTFDGTIIAGLFVFYAFWVVLAQRLEKGGKRVYISGVISYLAVVQLIFSISSILVLVEVSYWALILAIIGLILLVVFSLAMIVGKRPIQLMS